MFSLYNYYEKHACKGILNLNIHNSDNVAFIFQAHLRYVPNNNECYDIINVNLQCSLNSSDTMCLME